MPKANGLKINAKKAKDFKLKRMRRTIPSRARTRLRSIPRAMTLDTIDLKDAIT